MENGPELAELGRFKTKLCDRCKVEQDVAHCPWTVLYIKQSLIVHCFDNMNLYFNPLCFVDYF